jgi:SAM-dependent methyltransferase
VSSQDSVEHPWEDWTWDENVFEGTAAYYRQGRKPCAPILADALAARLHLNGRGRLLDVGCGPGTVALLFGHLFGRVVGLDADPGMLAEAARAAAEERVNNATWVQMRAEELPSALGCFRVIVFGQSFHWMDRFRVAAAVRGMIEADGAVVQVDLWHQTPPGRAYEWTLSTGAQSSDRRATHPLTRTRPPGARPWSVSSRRAAQRAVVVLPTPAPPRTSTVLAKWSATNCCSVVS